MTEEDIVKKFITGFTKFQEDEQLKRAKEMKSKFEKINDATLKWVQETCKEILNKRNNKPKCIHCGDEVEPHDESCGNCFVDKTTGDL